MEPVDVHMYLWVDLELVGIIYYFDIAEKIDEDHVEVGPFFDWSISHVDIGKRTCNLFDKCFVPFSECVFT